MRVVYKNGKMGPQPTNTNNGSRNGLNKIILHPRRLPLSFSYQSFLILHQCWADFGVLPLHRSYHKNEEKGIS